MGGVPLDANAIDKFVKDYARVISSGRPLNEANTRTMIVNPFLMALGWSFVPEEVECEYPIQIGSKTQPVDYCLKVDEGPAALLEAKPLRAPLDSSAIQQALSYARVAQLRWAFLTNGEEFLVLDAEARAARERVILRFDVARMKEHPQYVRAISQEGVSSGILSELAEELAARQDAVAAFERQLPAARRAVAEAVASLPVPQPAQDEAIQEFFAHLRGVVEGSVEAAKVEAAAEPVSPPLALGLPRLARDDLPGPDDALVVVCPANPDGVGFIQRYHAWAQVFLKEKPDYCALYVTKPQHQVRFVAPVRRMVPVPEWVKERGLDGGIFRQGIKPHKFVLDFGESPVELEDPIQWTPGQPHVQGPRYTTLGALRTARGVADLRPPSA